MSHYLEHMLFMGSERFPDENDYDSYLQRHGGSANAFTEMVWCGMPARDVAQNDGAQNCPL